MNLNDKVFNLTSPNFMLNKTYKVSKTTTGALICVASPFVGNWEFEISSSELDYGLLCLSLTRYCAGELIQNCFPTIAPEKRESFITPPHIWETLND
jgi:hypothetical protein